MSWVWFWQLLGSHVCEKLYQELKESLKWGAELIILTCGSQGNKATSSLGSWVIRSFQTLLGDIGCLCPRPAFGIWFIRFLPFGESDKNTLHSSTYLCVFWSHCYKYPQRTSGYRHLLCVEGCHIEPFRCSLDSEHCGYLRRLVWAIPRFFGITQKKVI